MSAATNAKQRVSFTRMELPYYHVRNVRSHLRLPQIIDFIEHSHPRRCNLNKAAADSKAPSRTLKTTLTVSETLRHSKILIMPSDIVSVSMGVARFQCNGVRQCVQLATRLNWQGSARAH